MSPSIGIIGHIAHGSVCVAHLKRRFGKWARRDQSRALRVPDSLSSPMTAVRPVSRQRSSLVNPSAALDTLQARVEYPRSLVQSTPTPLWLRGGPISLAACTHQTLRGLHRLARRRLGGLPDPSNHGTGVPWPGSGRRGAVAKL